MMLALKYKISINYSNILVLNKELLLSSEHFHGNDGTVQSLKLKFN